MARLPSLPTEDALDSTELEPFGAMPDGRLVHRVVIGHAGLRVAVLSYGAAIQSIEVPDRDGSFANVVLGLTNLADYIAFSPHFGAVPGRYAGRIARGQFELDGVTYQLLRNDGVNTLHGGPLGFGKRAWHLVEHGPTHVDLSLTSPDGDNGFPGTLKIDLRYAVQESELSIDITARSDRPTILNLTNHSYFNLNGEGSGSVLGHDLLVHASHYAPADATSIPTGEIAPVAGTPFDFTQPRAIGQRIRDGHPQLLRAKGYDHTFLVDGEGLRSAAVLHAPESGRTLTVLSTQPALQLYTANTLAGTMTGPSNRAYRSADAVCLEAQHVPDAPNHPAFPSAVLRPSETFRASTLFRFGIRE